MTLPLLLMTDSSGTNGASSVTRVLIFLRYLGISSQPYPSSWPLKNPTLSPRTYEHADVVTQAQYARIHLHTRASEVGLPLSDPRWQRTSFRTYAVLVPLRPPPSTPGVMRPASYCVLISVRMLRACTSDHAERFTQPYITTERTTQPRGAGVYTC